MKAKWIGFGDVNVNGLTIGKTYSVEKLGEHFYVVKDDCGFESGAWLAEHFEFENAKSSFDDAKPPTDDANPKDALGMKKVNLFLVPPVLSLHTARAFEDGARKYGPYNWREKKVRASIYLSAIDRHVKAWQDGESTSADAGVHHLGHAAACIAILLDAEATGNLIDDRPKPGNFGALVAEFTKKT